jgi:hypothetical protein
MQRKQPCVAEGQNKPEADMADVVGVVDIDIEVLQILLPTPFWFVHFVFDQTYKQKKSFTLQHKENAV